LILLLETSTDICSVGLASQSKLIHSVTSDEPNVHSSLLTVLIAQCLSEAGASISDLKAIAVSDGPGSFTSLRVGAAVAKGMCYALALPLIKIESLKAIAIGVLLKSTIKDKDTIRPMIDARRLEVYTALYDDNLVPIEEISAFIATEHHELYIPVGGNLHLCGDGARKIYEYFSHQEGLVLHDVIAHARNLVLLAEQAFEHGKFENIAYYTPSYLKGASITVSKKKFW